MLLIGLGMQRTGYPSAASGQALGGTPQPAHRTVGGDRAKVWVLAPGLSSDAPGGQPVDAGPSPEAELAAAREQVRALQELADYRGKLLDKAEWRYRELLEELRRSQAMLEGLTRALPPGGTEESPRGRRWWPFGPG